METTAIKKEFRDLSSDKLQRKKDRIATFLFDNPNLENIKQGQATLAVLNQLIRYKKSKNEFGENIVRGLFFQ